MKKTPRGTEPVPADLAPPTWQPGQSQSWPRTPEPALASFLIDRPRCQGPPVPQRRFRQTPPGSQDGYLGTVLEADPRRGRGHAAEAPPGTWPRPLSWNLGIGHPTPPHPRSIQVCFHILALHPSAHLEGTRGLSFWREPHQVRETHKAMGRWEPNLG